MKRHWILLALFLAAIVALAVAGRVWQKVAPPKLSFTEQCLKDGNMWHEMPPLKNGVQGIGEKKPGCMTADGQQHFTDEATYAQAKNPGETVATLDAGTPRAGESTMLHFAIKKADGTAPELFREHERYLHVVILSKDMSVFRHVHPDDQPGFSDENVKSADFSLPFTFPTAGEYLVAIDYAHQLKHESRQFKITVGGESAQGSARIYESPASFDGYDVDLQYASPRDGITTLRYTIRKDGVPVTDLSPYLAAAMHVAVVKNDLSAFIHAHGEVHPPGYVPTQASVANHVHQPPPQQFGPTVEAHVIFPSPGLYTVFGEFKRGTVVIPTKFTVRVED
jgi:Cu+-exporting ATPase